MVGDRVWVIALAVGLVLAASYDLWARRVPNWLVVAIALAGFAARGTLGAGPGLLSAVAGLALGFSIMFMAWRVGWVGGGDVKLCAACGAWLGPRATMEMLALAAVGAGVLALVVLARGGSVFRREVTLALTAALARGHSPPVRHRPPGQTVPLEHRSVRNDGEIDQLHA